MTRAATWTNSDGLVVGFGANAPERNTAGVSKQFGTIKEARLQVTYQSTSGASGAKITVPAGSAVRRVRLHVGTAWVGGTNLQFGDGTTAGGWVSSTNAATANLTAGAEIVGSGVYVTGGTDTTAMRFPKVYAAATDLFLTITGTYTAGDATIVVEYE
jgi:hypothetical protein